MDSQEANFVAVKELEALKGRPFGELARLVEPENVQTREVQGPSGRTYYVEATAAWDTPAERLRVSVLVDNGGFRSFFPLARDIVVSRH